MPEGSDRARAAADDVTIRDVLGVLARRRALAIATFLLVLGATVLASVLTPTVYQATSSIVPTADYEPVVLLVRSEAYSEDVAQAMGLVDELGGGDVVAAGAAVRASVRVMTGVETLDDLDYKKLTFRVRSTDPDVALRIATGYQDSIARWRPWLQNVSFDMRWEAYQKASEKPAEEAAADLRAYLREYAYTQEIDGPRLEDEPVLPDWRLNLVVGTATAIFAALFVPFLVESVSASLRSRRTA